MSKASPRDYGDVMTETLTLADFLLARIDEDEALARSAAEFDRDGKVARWRDGPRPGDGNSYVANGVGQDVVSHAVRHQGAHIARHDPFRVLRECRAKRQTVWMHDGEHYCPQNWGDAGDEYAHWPYPGLGDRYGFTLPHCPTIRFLAAAYADHPDYLGEWGLF